MLEAQRLFELPFSAQLADTKTLYLRSIAALPPRERNRPDQRGSEIDAQGVTVFNDFLHARYITPADFSLVGVWINRSYDPNPSNWQRDAVELVAFFDFPEHGQIPEHKRDTDYYPNVPSYQFSVGKKLGGYGNTVSFDGRTGARVKFDETIDASLAARIDERLTETEIRFENTREEILLQMFRLALPHITGANSYEWEEYATEIRFDTLGLPVVVPIDQRIEPIVSAYAPHILAEKFGLVAKEQADGQFRSTAIPSRSEAVVFTPTVVATQEVSRPSIAETPQPPMAIVVEPAKISQQPTAPSSSFTEAQFEVYNLWIKDPNFRGNSACLEALGLSVRDAKSMVDSLMTPEFDIALSAYQRKRGKRRN